MNVFMSAAVFIFKTISVIGLYFGFIGVDYKRMQVQLIKKNLYGKMYEMIQIRLHKPDS